MNIERILQNLPAMSVEERDRLRGNAERWRSTGTPEQKTAAMRVLDAMEALAEAEHQALVDRLGGMEIAARIAEAFRVVPMSDADRKVIQVLLDHPGSTSRELSAALGWGGMSWHMHFGTMCEKRAVYLWPGPWAEKRNAEFYSGILADFDDEDSRFTMKPEVVKAFAPMGLKARPA